MANKKVNPLMNVIRSEFPKKLQLLYSVSPEDASDKQVYQVLSSIIVEILGAKRQSFINHTHSIGGKQIYYLSMEFLMGRSLKTSIYNLELADDITSMLKEYDINLDKIYEYEPDAGLGNGGLGRLAACYLDGLATTGFPAMGYSICYEYGIFQQKLEDGWQTELPDNWLPGGSVWLVPKPELAIDIHFEGDLQEYWDNQYHYISHVNYNTVVATPYDMYVSGYGGEGVSVLRLWSAKAPNFNMEMFNKGNYEKALAQNSIANAISKILYPNDNHLEGKSLRLRQQYFLCAASIGDIVNTHMNVYGTLENLADKVAIHINDTHPTLAIPELMRILLDDCGYTWEKAWDIVTRTVAYTNHTVMAEALEKWPVSFIQTLLPRVWMIIAEIDRRYCDMASQHVGNDWGFVERTRPVRDGMLHMASLAIIGSHSVNGVAEIHSEILRNDLFRDYTVLYPDKFNNKTNGITHRRWLLYANPQLRNMLDKNIGKSYETDWHHFEDLMKYVDEPTVQDEFLAVKEKRKEILADYVKDLTGEIIDPHSIIDTQAKRLHAYKRQLLNIMQVIYLYQRMKADPNFRIYPHTYLFAAKAASSYAFAKNVIKLINNVAWKVNSDPDTKDYLKVVFLPNHCVTMAETLVPGTDISEQISTAGKEASGTGNMKFMMNGAITLGTLDGANVEIDRLVGRENDVIFGLTVEQLEQMRYNYNAFSYYQNDERIRNVMDTFINGFWTGDGNDFRLIYDELRSKNDEFFVLADFDAYVKAQEEISARYQDRRAWAKSCLVNIAKSGYFSSDRTIEEYVRDIWHINSYKF